MESKSKYYYLCFIKLIINLLNFNTMNIQKKHIPTLLVIIIPFLIVMYFVAKLHTL